MQPWNPATDDKLLVNVNEDTYLQLVAKYGDDAVNDRLQFLHGV